MSDYTPTTEQIRDDYVWWNTRDDGVGPVNWWIAEGKFDRWLAQQEAEISNAERQRLAKTVWEEKQKVFEAITKDPTNSELIAYQSGLWRALDIIEGKNNK